MFAPLVAGDERIGLLVVRARAVPWGGHSAIGRGGSHRGHAQAAPIDRVAPGEEPRQGFLRASSREGRASTRSSRSWPIDSGSICEPSTWSCTSSPRAKPAADGRRRPERLRSDTKHPAWHDLARQVRSRLDAILGALFDHDDRSLQALVAVTERSPADVLTTLREMVWDDGSGAPLSVGVSNVCRGRASFPQGFEEAAAAAKVGALIRGSPALHLRGARPVPIRAVRRGRRCARPLPAAPRALGRLRPPSWHPAPRHA